MGKKNKARAEYKKRNAKKKRRAAHEATLQRKQHAEQQAANARYKAWAEDHSRQKAQSNAWTHICHDKVA